MISHYNKLPFSNGDPRSSFILRSSIIGVVSPEVKLLSLPPTLSSRLIVGLPSTKLKELHSSDVGDTNGVKVGVAELGRVKNVSNPSPKLCEDNSVSSGLVGARFLTRFGRLLTRCCSCIEVLGNSVIESQFSSFLSGDPTLDRFEIFGDSSRSGM